MKQSFFQRLLFKKVARHLRKPSGWFGKKVGIKMNAANAFLYDAALDIMKPADHDSILEIGFGNGKFFEKIFSKANGLRLTGIDFSEKMVEEAKKNNAASWATGLLQLYKGSSDQLPFPDNSFDIIFCINVVYFWDPAAPHLKEIYRVLKPGGKFYSVIRSKESIQQMPFANYGFIKYTRDEWTDILQHHQLNVKEVNIINETAATLKGDSYPVTSWCFVGEK
ncbi:MAG: class I SAM-dependent methyltransferase [Bacteroidota bacterium]